MYQINTKKPYEITLYGIEKLNQKTESTLTKKYLEININNFNLADVIWAFKNKLSSYSKSINIDLNSFIKIIPSNYIEPFIIQAILVNETINALPFSKKSECNKINNNFIISNQLWKKYEKKVNALVESHNLAQKLMLMPHNYLNPSVFIDEAIKALLPYMDKLDFIVLNKEGLVEKKMGLILGVSAGSNENNEPKFLAVKFKNDNPNFVLVGKGVTFDTGGINLKPSNGLKGMQYDMSGAAISLSVFLACLKLNLKPNFGIVIPLVVNDIGSNSTKVGDILTSYSKKTVEITNTDAEGRLILADALTYAFKDMKAKSAATIATLTGAITVAFGDVYTGYWTNDENINNKLLKANKLSGEYLWRMPLNDIFLKEMQRSLLADCINCELSRNAGSITAAEFLLQFADKHSFIHFDIAGTNEVKSRGFTLPHPILMYTLFKFINNETK